MKRVLLIAGGGTLGRYAAKELLRLGCAVDTICHAEMTECGENQRYFHAHADLSYLQSLLAENSYDGIVNFVHYPDVEEYKQVYRLLIANTAHLVFLSSYRVYADLQHPVTESAPRLFDVVKDEAFLLTEDYAVPKSKAEDFLTKECSGQNWTIVRPVISFSDKRFDLFTHYSDFVIKCAENNRPIELPECAKNLTAGLDWAGNTGKIIADLLFKKDAIGEAFTISSAQNLTWGEVAEIYSRLLRCEINYIPEAEFAAKYHPVLQDSWNYWYDRLYDRRIDNTKVLRATGLTSKDFVSIENGIKKELARYYERKNAG